MHVIYMMTVKLFHQSGLRLKCPNCIKSLHRYT